MEETLALLGNPDKQNVSAAAEQIVQLEQDIAEVWDWEGSWGAGGTELGHCRGLGLGGELGSWRA